MTSRKTKAIWEFGDFQTPLALAKTASSLVSHLGFVPQSILEPTCGRGAFLLAAAASFPEAKCFVGVEINKEHLAYCRRQTAGTSYEDRMRLLHGDFFSLGWESVLAELPEPLLIIGNPPWVTSSELGLLGSQNLPEKSNFHGRSGIEALTGKSNFDISEWMLLKQMEWLQTRNGVLAMLCKTSVARKVLIHAWKHGQKMALARIYKIDALKYFGAAVDACFFVVDCTQKRRSKDCEVYEHIEAAHPSYTIGYHDDILVVDVAAYKRWKHLRGTETAYVWRSGLKHDCSKVMELKRYGKRFRNGFDREVDLEETYLFPLYKSSDIGNGRLHECRKCVLVTQRTIGEDTEHIAQNAPATWKYLQENKALLDKRASIIYKNKPPFSIFGVGEYTFAPWKVAISGFYKKLDFKVIGPVEGRTAMLDDTIYFLPCDSREEAQFLADMLNSVLAREFLSSMIFWADKRPITVELLKRLNMKALTKELGREAQYKAFVTDRFGTHRSEIEQSNLFVV